MDHVSWSEHTTLNKPIIITAFEGWNDAGDAATTAASFLRDRWSAETLATLDPEIFFDFSTTRPAIQLLDGAHREIRWPDTVFSASGVPGMDRDVVVMLGSEPQLRWRTFCEEVVAIAQKIDASMVITLGALISDVAHSRPVEIYGVGYDTDVVRELDLEQSNYEGPTGIVGVLHAACRDAGITSASLWAAVPGYVPSAPSPKAALALVERVLQMLRTDVVTTDLEIATAAYERQVDELVGEDEDTSAYVRQLEERHDDLDKGDDLVEEVERFLRDSNPD